MSLTNATTNLLENDKCDFQVNMLRLPMTMTRLRISVGETSGRGRIMELWNYGIAELWDYGIVGGGKS